MTEEDELREQINVLTKQLIDSERRTMVWKYKYDGLLAHARAVALAAERLKEYYTECSR